MKWIDEIDPLCLPSQTVDRTAQIKAALQSNAALGRDVYFRSGTYLISGNILDMVPGKKVCLRGEGITRTVFKLNGDLPSGTVPFKITGSEAYADPFGHMSYVTVDGIEFNGNNKICETWFDLKFCAHLKFSNCLWTASPYGGAVRGFSWWDTLFSWCNFTKLLWGVYMMPASTTPGQLYSWCNNICFEGSCRFEEIAQKAVIMSPGTRKCRLLSVKFDRVLQLCVDARGDQENRFVACQATHCGPFLPLQDLGGGNKVLGEIWDP